MHRPIHINCATLSLGDNAAFSCTRRQHPPFHGREAYKINVLSITTCHAYCIITMGRAPPACQVTSLRTPTHGYSGRHTGGVNINQTHFALSFHHYYYQQVYLFTKTLQRNSNDNNGSPTEVNNVN